MSDDYRTRRRRLLGAVASIATASTSGCSLFVDTSDVRVETQAKTLDSYPANESRSDSADDKPATTTPLETYTPPETTAQVESYTGTEAGILVNGVELSVEGALLADAVTAIHPTGGSTVAASSAYEGEEAFVVLVAVENAHVTETATPIVSGLPPVDRWRLATGDTVVNPFQASTEDGVAAYSVSTGNGAVSYPGYGPPFEDKVTVLQTLVFVASSTWTAPTLQLVDDTGSPMAWWKLNSRGKQ